MEKPNDLVPIEKAAEQLGVSRVTLWRRVKEWKLPVYTSPLNKRQRLISWAAVQEAAEPRRASA